MSLVTIELIEEIKEEMTLTDKRERENYWIEKLNPNQIKNKIKNPNYQKEWRIENKDKLKEDKSKYYKEVLKAKNNDKKECPHCEQMFSKSNLAKHIKRFHS
jgi:ribosomal protein S27AE